MSVKKLIEVALPMDAINDASAYDKMPGIGPHPKGLHQWWARLPLPSARVVLFASIIDDPSSHPDKFPTEEEQDRERKRLHALIRRMMHKHAPKDEELWHQVQQEILRATNGSPPPVLDPFCGGGSIPLEAQRLGLEAYASDLNPVAVLITKALIEIPLKFAGQPPVHPDDKGQTKAVQTWKGAQGLAEDVRYYGRWMRDEAEKRIGHLYPKVKITPELAKDRPDLKQYVGQDITVIAWLWARTVTCPNPACNAQMPLVRSFALSTKSGKQAWVEPIVEDSPFADPQKALAGMGEAQEVLSQNQPQVRFKVKTGQGQAPEGTVNRQGTRCICCDTPVPFNHARREGRAGRMSARLMAIVAEGQRERVYLPPNKEHVSAAVSAEPENVPDTDLPEKALGFRIQQYGMTKHRHLFTPRQLVALTTFNDLVGEAREKVLADARTAGLPDDGKGIEDGGNGAQAYADAVATYLAMAVDRATDFNNSLCRWVPGNEKVINLFARQAIPMVWDYAEANILARVVGGFFRMVEYICKCINTIPINKIGMVYQLDAVASEHTIQSPLISTDPPYFANIGYADLSDFFYVWLRRSIGKIYPIIFSTVLVPKSQELVATPYRFDGNATRAKEFFKDGFLGAFRKLRQIGNKEFPLTVYYAYQQSEEVSQDQEGTGGVVSTGWESMLEGLMQAGLAITATWPVHASQKWRLVSMGTNALATYIVLACRPRLDDAPLTTRRDFIEALKSKMPKALRGFQDVNIPPVDLEQAAIGPGMAIYSQYNRVVEPDGSSMSVRTALKLINQIKDECLEEQESEYDRDTRWALVWYEQHGFNNGPYGDAELLSKAKDTSLDGLVAAGILQKGAGNARLLRWEELDPAWDPATDKRMPVWEVTQHLCHALATGGEAAAAEIAGKLGARGEIARDLAYRLYILCKRKGWAQEALAYNSLVIAWPEIQRRVQAGAGGTQTELGL